VPATLIGGYALRYVNFDPAPLADEIRANMLHAPVPFVLHTTFGGVALSLGPGSSWPGCAGAIPTRIAGSAAAMSSAA
jgi:hypothetical protein